MVNTNFTSGFNTARTQRDSNRPAERYIPNRQDNRKKKRQYEPDSSIEEALKKPYKPEQAAWEKRALDLDAVPDNVLPMEGEYDDAAIIEALSQLNSSLGENKKLFRDCLKKLLHFLPFEYDKRSVYVRFIIQRLLYYFYYLDDEIIEKIRALIMELNLLDEKDPDVEIMTRLLIQKIDGKKTEDPVETPHKRIAFIIHPSAALSTAMPEDVYILSLSSENVYKSIYDQFQALFQAEYTDICVLLPPARFWRSYEYVTRVTASLKKNIHVFDTNIYGFGLTALMMILKEQFAALTTIDEIPHIVKMTQMQIHYWIILTNLNHANKRKWVQRLIDESGHEDLLILNKKLILSLSGNLTINAAHANTNEAITDLGKRIINFVTKWLFQPSRIIIDYFERNSDAEALAQHLRDQLPNIEILLNPTHNSYMSTELGPFIGVCVY